MKADCIVDIMKQLIELPYKCIMFDGVWGIGKSYAIGKAMEGKDNVCKISMFGLKSSQQIYHEVLFQLLLNNGAGGKFGTGTMKFIKTASIFSKKMELVKNVVENSLAERELFLMMSKRFKEYHIIIIDDLERISKNVNLQEVLGIIEELKNCNYVKVVIVANSEGLEGADKELLKKYCEKVIDRDYNITERPNKINWGDLKIAADFITDFLDKHSVSNLRTLQKAQNFYEDVKVQCTGVGNEEFQKEIRLICYAIVVEDTDNLYYHPPTVDNKDSASKITEEMGNRFDHRIINYLRELKSASSLVEIIYKYYTNEANIESDELKVQYQLFLKAGKKANFYKTDEEISKYLDAWRSDISKAKTIGELNRFADEYVFWCTIIDKDYSDILMLYKEMLHTMLWDAVQTGHEDLLSYSVGLFNLSTDTIKECYKSAVEKLRIKTIELYISFLKQETIGNKAFDYSYKLRNYYDNDFYREIINDRIEELMLKSSFPIDRMSETKYHTCYNILYVLYRHDEEKLLRFCDKLIEECDSMARHRIKQMMEAIMAK